ncbi:MAG TPA: transglycosylase domain-containing protein [Chitinophagaceae bacterium]|nr:transglycosylase domain-containing protein [Chitinophagaceae bacterium]
MNKDVNGYVVYGKESDIYRPFGVVSDNYECQAIADHIPTKIKGFLVDIEDKRFYNHHGIDPKGIIRAIFQNVKALRVVQGGSSITQQLSRNLLRDNRKSISRKFKETVKAIKIESKYSKGEILDLYFNNIYFGKNIRGIRAAGICYFGKEINQLTEIELLSLLTILRGPNYYLNHPDKFRNRFNMLNQKLYEDRLITKNRHQKNLKAKITFQNNYLQKINEKVVPFICERRNDKKRIITTTIEKELQTFSTQYVLSSKYPVSIIAIRNKQVVGFASTYGADYPFISKTNVGSTLKPFLYCHLREKGISKIEKFNAYGNELGWAVREAKYVKPYLNLDEALFYSNNNAFINACSKVQIKSSLEYLAINFKKEIENFFPSSILGATRDGLSLYDLGLAYSNFFVANGLNENKKECLSILNKIANYKLGYSIENIFLKTGTTNDNKERYAILGNPDITFVTLRNENPINDDSKEGGFLKYISKTFSPYFSSKRNYKWS